MKYVQETFFKQTFLCAPSFLVCARLTTCVRVHTHSLEGTLITGNIGVQKHHVLVSGLFIQSYIPQFTSFKILFIVEPTQVRKLNKSFRIFVS